MKSELKFFDHASGKPSDCGAVLDIELSAGALNWDGVVVEKGSSPCFYPQHVSTPYFYFALGLEAELHWQAQTAEGLSSLVTVPGNIWINPPATPFTHQIDEPCYFIIVAVEKTTFFNYCPLTVDVEKVSFLNNYNVQDNVLKGIIELFLLEADSGGKNGSAYVHSLIAMLSLHYLNNYSDLADSTEAAGRQSVFDIADLNTVDRYIDAHIDQQISIDEMAELLRCSKFYFLREFKKLTGMTPYQHLLNRRLEKARSRLLQGQQSLLAISLELGFSDQSHFTRAFKQRFGITPGKFR